MTHSNPVDSQTVTVDPGQTVSVTLEWTQSEKGYWVATVTSQNSDDSERVEIYDDDTTITAPAATSSGAAMAPTLTSRITASASPAPATASSTAPVPALTSRITASPTAPVATATGSAPTPTTRIAGTATLSPAPATASSTSPTPSILDIENPTISPNSATASSTTPLPTVTSRVTASATAPTATVSESTPLPTVSSIKQATVGPSAAAGSVSSPAPSVSAANVASVTAGPATATSSTAAPSVSAVVGAHIYPEEARSSSLALVPLVGPEISLTVTTPVTAATSSAPVPTILERVRGFVFSPPAEATTDSPTPHVEGIAPLETIPAAAAGEAVPAETAGQFAPDLTGMLSEADEPDFEGPVPDNHRYREAVDTADQLDFEPSVDPPKRVVTEDAEAYTPARRVYINGERIDADRDITVSASEYGYQVADVTFYNLSVERWQALARSDEIRVELGWEGVMSETVFVGEIVVKRNHGSEYTIRARGKAGGLVTQRLSRSYIDLSPHRIVEQLIADIPGLGRGYIGVGSNRINGSYSLGSGRELNDWLDKLASRASNDTGERWVWYLENGDLYFHPAKMQVTDIVTFSLEKSVQRIRPAGMVTPQSKQKYEVFMRCEPVARRGLTCNIEGADTIDPSHVFRVSEYLHESSTTGGSHHTTVSLEPMFKEVGDLRSP